MMRRLRGAIILGAGALAVLLTAISGILFFARPFAAFDDERRALSSKVWPGMTEDEVVRSLGKPSEVQSPGTGQQRCQVDGYSHTERTISNRCLVYFGAYDAIAYVYIDGNGRVEDVFVGGS